MHKSSENLRVKLSKNRIFLENSNTVQNGLKVAGKSLKVFGNLRKLSENFEIFEKLWKRFETVFPELLNYLSFRKIFGSVWKSSKFSENFWNGFKLFFRSLYDFVTLSESFRKSSEVLGNHRSWSELFGNIRRSWKVSELNLGSSQKDPCTTVARK